MKTRRQQLLTELGREIYSRLYKLERPGHAKRLVYSGDWWDHVTELLTDADRAYSKSLSEESFTRFAADLRRMVYKRLGLVRKPMKAGYG